MGALFSPRAIRGLTFSNRIAVSPMCQYAARDGKANDWHLIHLGGLASSGAGMLFIEGTAVEPEGRITPGDLGLWDDATQDALAVALNAVRRYSKIPVLLQIAHAGRKGSNRVPWEGGELICIRDGGWATSAPSAVPQKPGEPAPHALDGDGLRRVHKAFADTARRASRMGLDGLEIHGAHGYLLHEFLSPLANQRTDEYGGSLENRMRFPLEVFETVREAFPSDRPLGVKVSAVDWVEGGWDLTQTIEYAKELKRRGVDWITVSSAGVSPLQKIGVSPGYQVPFAQAVRARAGVATIAVGLITGARQAQEIVASGKADLVALARGMLYDPRWPWHAAAELGATVDAPAPSYWRAAPQGHSGLFGTTRYGAR